MITSELKEVHVMTRKPIPKSRSQAPAARCRLSSSTTGERGVPVDKTIRSKNYVGLAARAEAQRIAHGPIMFQAARLLRELGVLAALERAQDGATVETVRSRVDVSDYGLTVLLEAGLGMGIVSEEQGRFRLTAVGDCLLHDEMTRVNMEFVQHCCVEPVQYLEQSIREGRPAGLHEVFGERETVYPALTRLPEPARRSWFAWDHYYSDAAYPAALEIVAERPARTLLDIGGNRGEWATRFVRRFDGASATVLDLPSVLEVAREGIAAAGLEDRVLTLAVDLLDPTFRFPTGFDALWMSQLLVCFGEEDVQRLLQRAAAAMDHEATLYILDTFQDRQRFAAASYCLQAASLYFTFLANGTSRMYRFETIRGHAERAGLRIERVVDDLGVCSSLVVCRRIGS